MDRTFDYKMLVLKKLKRWKLPISFTFEQFYEYLIVKYNGRPATINNESCYLIKLMENFQITNENLPKIMVDEAINTAKQYDYEDVLNEQYFQTGRPLRYEIKLGNPDGGVMCLFNYPEMEFLQVIELEQNYPIELDYIFMGSLTIIDEDIIFIDDFSNNKAQWAKEHHRLDNQESQEIFYQCLHEILEHYDN